MAPLAPVRLGLNALVLTVVAARRDILEHGALDFFDEDDVASILKLSDGTNKMCGSTQIWSLLTAGITEADEVKTIQWKVIESEKQNHLTTRGSEKESCETELKGLQDRLKEMSAKDLPSTTEEQHMQMIESSMSVFGELGAVAHGCGFRRRIKTPEGKRVVISAEPYEKSVADFGAAARAFFEKKEARLDGNAFQATCHAKLQVKKTSMDEEGYCKELCGDFQRAAQAASNSFVGAAAVGVDELKDKISQKETCIREAKVDLDSCESDWKALVVFRDQLAELTQVTEDRFKSVRAAKSALNDAETQMDNLWDNLEAQEKALADAITALAGATGEETGAKGALEDAKAKETDLLDKVNAASAELRRLTVELENAGSAGTKSIALKGKVEMVMQLMDDFAEAALREPVRNIGFDDFLDNLVFPDHLTSQAAGEVESQVATVRKQCDISMPAFAALKQSSDIDLSPLCSFKETKAVFTDLAAQVDLRKKLVKADMEKVMSWLTCYKHGKALTTQEFEAAVAEEEDLVGKGQAANLEKVKSVYSGGSSFYKYLIGWRLNGPFMDLTGKLQVLNDQLVASKAQAEKDLASLQEQLAAAQKTLKEATEALAAATQKLGDADEHKAALEKVVADLKEQEETMQSNLDALTAAWRKAMKLYAEAQDALFKAHQEGVKEEVLMQTEDEYVKLLGDA